MQTSGSSSSTSGRAGWVGLAVLVFPLFAAWVSCSPGEPDCENLGNLCKGGGSGGGNGGAGGSGPPPRPSDCDGLGVATLAQFETKFIVPKCGQVMCHGPMSVFPPRGLDVPAMIRPNTVGKKSTLACKEDFYIDKTDFRKSFMLHKVEATGTMLSCPTPTDKPDSGGTRMPNKTDPTPMPTIPGDRLSEAEIACFTWWVESLSKL
jgi:hypothetical protein